MKVQVRRSRKGSFKSTKLLPNNIEIFNNLAVIEAEKGNIEEAIKIFTKSLSLNQNLNTIYSNLTNLYAYRANILYEQALDIENEQKPLNLHSGR